MQLRDKSQRQLERPAIYPDMSVGLDVWVSFRPC